MGAMPVVAVKPARQLSGAVFRSFVGCGVGPFAQAGLNEALGLSVGFGRVGPGTQVLDLEPAQGLGVAAGAAGNMCIWRSTTTPGSPIRKSCRTRRETPAYAFSSTPYALACAIAGD